MNRYLPLHLCLLVFLLQACSQFSPSWNSEQPYEPNRTPRLGDILHIPTGHMVEMPQMLKSLSFYPLVYVGEVHDNPASHRLQLEVLKAMQVHHPGQLSLGMEMFNHQQQDALDRWVAGELSEKEFLRESRWYQNWGLDFALYRDLLEYCRDHKIAVVGLNATPQMGAKVSMTALDELDSETRKSLPQMDMSDSYQHAMIEQVFAGHGAGATMLDSFTRRQVLWDETMAQSVADYLSAGSDQRMLVIAGGWHIDYGFGIPRRVHRRLPLPYALVGGYNLVVPAQRRDQLMDVNIPDMPMPAVDYLVYQEYEAFEARGVRLGIELGDSADQAGLLISKTEPGSVAAKAGIRQGDWLLKLNGVVLEENFDLIFELKNRRAGSTASIELRRADQTLKVEAYFDGKATKHR